MKSLATSKVYPVTNNNGKASKAARPNPGFKAGKSGNPRGRPKGAKSMVKLLASEYITEEDVRVVVRAVVSAARDGDMQAASIVLDRVLPRLRPICADPGAEVELAAAMAEARARVLSGKAGAEPQIIVVRTGLPDMEAPDTGLIPPKSLECSVHSPSAEALSASARLVSGELAKSAMRSLPASNSLASASNGVGRAADRYDPFGEE